MFGGKAERHYMFSLQVDLGLGGSMTKYSPQNQVRTLWCRFDSCQNHFVTDYELSTTGGIGIPPMCNECLLH